MNVIQKNAAIFVAGHRGLVGSALIRNLKSQGYTNLITRTHTELDLQNQAQVDSFFASTPMDMVFVAAAKVGGIIANSTFPADFLYQNLMISTNVIHAAARAKTRRLIFLGSTCIYPKLAHQPIAESSLLTGPLETTNEAYAIAKIAGLKMCEMYQKQLGCDFASAMPTNLYGPNDNFHPDHSHVIPGMLRKFHEAKKEGKNAVTVWGTGSPMREFIHVDDLADALINMMNWPEMPSLINMGTGDELSIAQLAGLVKEVTGFKGEIRFDSSKPDGTPRKVCDVSKLKAHGWQPKIKLRDGLIHAYQWAIENKLLL